VVGVDVNASISLPKVWSNFEQQQLSPPTAYLFGDVATQQVQVRHHYIQYGYDGSTDSTPFNPFVLRLST
jgi:hypothetical protein